MEEKTIEKKTIEELIPFCSIKDGEFEECPRCATEVAVGEKRCPRCGACVNCG